MVFDLFTVCGKEFTPPVSIGLAEVTGSVLDAIHKADVMMYSEKKGKKVSQI